MHRTLVCALSIASIAQSASATLIHSDSLVIVVPNGNSIAEGNANNYLPFGDSADDRRYQQVYGASDFPTGPLRAILQIAFRADGDYGKPSENLSLTDVQLFMSTTEAAPDALSGTFADNIGQDEQLVYSGPLAMSTLAGGPVGGPHPFDVVLRLHTPDHYDPSAGNLLLDIRVLGGLVHDSFIDIFDAQNTVGDAVSRVWNNPRDSTTSYPDAFPSLGLVTQFTLAPEPNAALLLTIGFGAVARPSRTRQD